MGTFTSVELLIPPFDRMTLSRLSYRSRQLWQALRARPAPEDLTDARRILGSDLFALFARMQPGEQAHSLRVLRSLQRQGEDHPDLLVAALLHDLGKCRHNLQPWERAWIVLAKAFFGRRARRWGQVVDRDLKSLPFWQQPLVVAEQHPAWGAELVTQAGGSALAASLICHHQDKPPAALSALPARLLASLQAVDDYS